MSRFVEVGGCACPAELAPFVRTVMRRTGLNPTTIYRGSEPEAVAILHANRKHTQAELYDAARRGIGEQYGIRGTPNRPGTSTHELRSDGVAFPEVASGHAIPPIQCGMDWPEEAVPRILEEFAKLGCAPKRPYGLSGNERQHICCTTAGRLDPLTRLGADPLQPGDKSTLVRQVQTYLVRAGLLPEHFDVAEEVGTYGPKAVAAVKAFQRAHGLPADGVVDKKTYAALRRRYGRRGSAMKETA